MKLSHLSDDEVEESALKAVRVEREALAVVLHHLREVERRKLYSKHRLESLFAYAVKIWGYSEAEAGRRISAMRLMRELPEIEAKIQTGALGLTHLTKAQAMFRREKKAQRPRSIAAKIEVLSMIEQMPVREVEKTLELQTYAPKPQKPLDLFRWSNSAVPFRRNSNDCSTFVLTSSTAMILIN